VNHETSEAPIVTRTHWYPERDDITIYGILAALSDPTRLAIVRQLAQHDERCPFDFLDLASKQNLSHHMKVLREAGLIMSRYEGRQKFIWLRRDPVDDMFPGLLDGVINAIEKAE